MSTLALEMKFSEMEGYIKKQGERLERIEKQSLRSAQEAKGDTKIIMENMGELRKSIDFVSKKFDDWQIRIEEIVNEQKTMKKEISRINENWKDFEKEMQELRKENQRLYAEKHEKEIEMVGLKINNEQNVREAVNECLTIIGCHEEIKTIVNVEREKNNRKEGNVIIYFKDKDIKDKVLKASKKKPIVLDKPNNVKSRVYVNERISPQTKYLLSRAKVFKNEYQWKFLWINGGMILLRKFEGQRAINLTSEKQLKELITKEQKEKDEV